MRKGIKVLYITFNFVCAVTLLRDMVRRYRDIQGIYGGVTTCNELALELF
jgi:hypothetical protein